MKINEMKKNNFYTDGERVIFKSKNGKNFYQLTESEKNNGLFIDHGVDFANIILKEWENIEVRKVEKDEVLMNGEVKVIDTKNLEILSINPLNAKINSRGEVENRKDLVYEEKKEIVNISNYMF